jgi:hypothetical protein
MADENEDEARERVMKRFEKIGMEIMNRTNAGGGMMGQDPVAGVLGDPFKRATAAQILGQAYVKAHNLVLLNRDAVERVADELVARKEIYGDDLVALLDRQQLQKPELDYGADETWPRI